MEKIPSMDPNDLSPHVASLIMSISAVPPAAVPAIIDCVLAYSDLSQYQLFSSLLHSFPDLNQASQSNQILSYTSALCHLVKNFEAPTDALRPFICRVFVPALKTIGTNGLELAKQIEGLVFDVVSKMQSWEIMGETLVPYCLRSVGLTVGMVRNDELAVYEWGSKDLLEFPGTFPLPIACRILISLLDYVLRSRGEVQREEKLEGFAANLIWDLSNLAVGMLMLSPEVRSFSVRLLLPTVFTSFSLFSSVKVLVHGVAHILSRSCFAKKMWRLCISLFSLGHLERLDAYNVLSLYFSSFYMIKLNENLARDNICKEFDLTDEIEFWEEIRRGLVEKDACLRKQALHILKISLSSYTTTDNTNAHNSSSNSKFVVTASDERTISCNGSSHANITKRGKWAEEEAKSLGVGEVCHLGDGCLSSQDRWKVFLLLYEMLEEYGTHLVEAAWTHQIALLLQSWSLNNYINAVSHDAYQVQMETIEGLFSWLAVLWERGFFHQNPQVRYLIMQSFLNIDWEKYAIGVEKVPRSFLLGPLVLGLNDVVHHKDFGVKGIYTSRTIEDATTLLTKFTHQFSPSERMEFVWSLASVAKKESFCRAGLMALSFCVASAACQSTTHSTRGIDHTVSSVSKVEDVKSIQEVLPSGTSDLLDVLGNIIERSKQHFNPNYRLQVCEQVINAAASMINVNNVSLEVLLHFLSAVPREFTDQTGQLRGMVQQWLTQNKDKGVGLGSSDTEDHVLKNLISFPVSFLKHKLSPDNKICFDDEDVNAWKLESQRWGRVLFLVIEDTKCLEPIFMFLQNYCSKLCKQDCGMDWVPLKLLLLIQSLVEELQIEWKKFASYDVAKIGREGWETKELDCLSFLVTSSDCEKFVDPFLFIMEEVVLFSRLVSPIFWSGSTVVDFQLPCAIKGRLGGPSLRRLAPLTTTTLLEAIMSLKAVAHISSWFAQVNGDDHLDSSFTYSWDFSWKVIESRTYDSETGAELCLAGYEALSYIFKAWTTTFTPSKFDFIRSYNESHYPDEENLPLLDPLVLRFLHNINDLLANGVLTRSRRAVLMNSKWHCLDSLLSTPYHVVQDGVHNINAQLFFSHSALRSTFSDIVESLENAGENSVLYILRSVRFVIGLLCSHDKSSAISASAGVNCEMMQQLVHSSWILHLSCNKRRVAPVAALLSAILHQSVFSNLRMHETDGGQQGPLKWFIEKLLDEGVKSPRTIRLAAMHLTGLWLLHPMTLKYYIKELKLLSLYGSVAFDEDFEAELYENYEARTEVSLLAQNADSELTEVFINTELYARVSIAVLFYELAVLVNRKGKQENEDSCAALHCGKTFLLELLDSAVNDKDLAKELYKKYSAVHRRKVRAWQMICILSNFVEIDIVEDVTSKLHICLYRNNLPAVRQYLETFAIQVYLKFPILAEEQLIPIFYDYNMRPQALSSYVFIATNVIIHTSDLPVRIKHLNELLPPIIPFLTSHHHSLRGFTQLLVHYVLCKMWPTLVPDTSKNAPLEKRCFEDLKSYLAENVDCRRLRTSMEGFLDAFDPNTSVTPAGVFSARNEGSEFECAPISLMEHVITFLNDVRDDLRNSIAKDAVTMENENLKVPDACKNLVEVLNYHTDQRYPQTPNDLSLDFQKKINLYETIRLAGNSKSEFFLSEMEKEDQLLNPVIQSRAQTMTKIRESQQQFILVASLVDRIPNLAGLARTCEVFKAAGLAVSNASIVQDKQFQLISVTAEKWVPILEVPVNSMKVFLEKKRQEGFSILGLEQTANSTPLDKYVFPNKTVLVLGREKEGIPVDIIHILDECIEIPQLGIIRSLNVHVSGAIALWEYTRQRKSRQQ